MSKFLLVDDEPIFNFLHTEVIQQIDNESEIYDFTSVADALTFLNNCLEQQKMMPQYMFVDLRMPGLSGFDFLEALMKFPKDALIQTQIYMVSSSLDERDREKALSFPIVKDFVEKIIGLELLKAITQKK